MNIDLFSGVNPLNRMETVSTVTLIVLVQGVKVSIALAIVPVQITSR